MDSKNRILNRGGFIAALTCLFVLACGPNGGMDSGMMMTDTGTPPGDSGPDIMPDAYVPPDVDGGMIEEDGGETPACSSADIASRTPGCGEWYDLPSGMSYEDAAMLPECMATLGPGHNWATTGTSGCPTDIWREAGTNQWMMLISCSGIENSPPYDGVFRLGADGSFYGNFGNATMAGEAGNHARLTPTASCRTLNGEFYRGGETTPFQTRIYTHE